ncbi:MAG: sigma-70 family RNA polymerase sigma factor [Nocardioides sp.]
MSVVADAAPQSDRPSSRTAAWATRALGADDARLADRDLLRRCLATLGPRQRACVVLRHYEDLSVAEVATILGCSEGTVRSQTKRGLEALARAWAGATGEELRVATADARSE